MKKRKYIFLLACQILCLTLLLSCGSAKNALESLVPADAVAFVQVANPDKLFVNVEAFLEGAKLKPMLAVFMGGKSLKETVLESAKTSLAEFDTDWLDLTKPAGLAISLAGADADMTMPDFYAYLPVTSKVTDAALKTYMDDSGIPMKKVGSYLVLVANEQLLEKCPPKTKLDLSRFNQYDDGTITAYCNFQKMFATYGLTKDSIKGMIDGTLMSESIPGNTQALADITNSLVDAIFQVDSFDTSVVFNKEHFGTQSNVTFTENGSVVKALTKLPANAKIKEFAKYIPADYLFSCVYNLNFKNLNAIIEPFMNKLTSALNISENDLKALREISAQSMAQMGNRMAFAFDVDLDPALGQLFSEGLSDPSMLTQLTSMFNFKLLAVSEIKDAAAFQKIMKNAISNATFKSMMDNLFKEMGVKFELIYAENQQAEGLTFDTIGYKVDFSGMTELSDPETLAMMSQVMTPLFDSFKIYIGYKGNRCYYVMGKEGAKLLKSVVDKDTSPGQSLLDSASAKGILAGMPDDSLVLSQFSINRVMELVSVFAKDQVPYTKVNDAPGIISYSRMNGKKLETHLYWSAAEIGNMIQQLGTAITALFSGGSGF